MQAATTSLFVLAAGATVAAATAGGCSEGTITGSGDCDVARIFESSCDGSGCHGSESPRANLDLVSPGVDQRLFYVPSTENCDERLLVVPGQPDRSLLYDKVANASPACGGRMPLGAPLPESDITCIRRYIEEAGNDTRVDDCETCGTILCVDVTRDPRHCGSCGQPCTSGEICAEGACINPCASDEALCGASCVDLSASDDHCGSCGHRCGPGSSCDGGACVCGASADGAGGATSNSPGVPPGSVSFEEDLLPLFASACSGSDCHTESDRTAPLGLDPDDAWEHLVNQASQDCDSASLVVPGDPDQSYLLEKLLGGSVCAGERMPLASDPLPEAAQALFVSWICDGAPNN